jgi:osmotically-inducible protein OsmY
MDTQQRSQAGLKAAVVDELDRTPGLGRADIRVDVHNGAVTLTGTVATHPDSALAEAAALRVPGVNAVAADLTVSRTGPLSDSEIAREASLALSRATELPANLVKATVADSWVTLTGQVETHYQRDVADRAVRHLPGIMGVHSGVTIRTPASAAELKSAISEALARNAELEAARITVTVEHGVVTLEGVVQSWAERQQACATVWSAPGVTDVENRLRVAN